MELPRYAALIAEYDALLAYAREVSGSLNGMVPAESENGYGEQIFVKLLGHAVTLRSLAPNPEGQGTSQLWDLSSTSTLARALVETYDALAYVALGSISSEERQFRLLLWEFHDSSRRVKMLESIGSSDPRYFEIVLKEQKLYERILVHPFLINTSKDVQKKIADRDPPPYHLTKRERCAMYQISFDYYNAVTMHLSQYVHTLPFAVHQLFAFKAGTPEALQLMSLPMQYALPFLSRAVQGIKSMFRLVAPEPSSIVHDSIAVWSGLLETGVRRAA